jgi:hypothetical protein
LKLFQVQRNHVFGYITSLDVLQKTIVVAVSKDNWNLNLLGRSSLELVVLNASITMPVRVFHAMGKKKLPSFINELLTGQQRSPSPSAVPVETHKAIHYPYLETLNNSQRLDYILL